MANGSKVFTGAKLKLSIITSEGGQDVAYANNVTYTINHNVQPIEVMGMPEVMEHAELGVTVEFTASMFRVNQKAAVTLGLMPKLTAFLTQPELIGTIMDNNGNTIIKVTGIKCISRTGNVAARDVASETLTFVGRKLSDEAGE